MSLASSLDEWPRSDRGASAAEYCLLVAGIAAVVVLIVFAFGGYIGGLFEDTCDSVDAVSTSVSSANCTP